MAYVESVYLNLRGHEVDCSSVKRGQDDSSDVVPTMNRENRAKGFKRGIMKYELEVEFPLDGTYGIDPEQMHEDKEEFSAVVEEEDGKIIEYYPCRFKKVDVNSKEGDVTTYTATIMSLDRVAS